MRRGEDAVAEISRLEEKDTTYWVGAHNESIPSSLFGCKNSDPRCGLTSMAPRLVGFWQVVRHGKSIMNT